MAFFTNFHFVFVFFSLPHDRKQKFNVLFKALKVICCTPGEAQNLGIRTGLRYRNGIDNFFYQSKKTKLVLGNSSVEAEMPRL